MRPIVIASDIHGSSFYCRKLIDAIHREDARRVFLLGDILYHGPRNELPRDYNPKAVIAMLNGLVTPVYGVRGNCDAEVDQMVLNFPIMSESCWIDCGWRMIFATHGHIYNENHLPPLSPGDILLHGHTHVPVWKLLGDDSYYVNPGSVSLPKENSPHSYMTLQDGKLMWKDLDGTLFHTMNV
ncbi:phosphodiesterase [Megasphaera hominis]|jgi:putative phosphoesterase|uniref:Phosphoesterase n=2 Tax=Megasphaera TaxID=906 RepID=A0ABR6VKC3_9FIRM|nr:phosphodiesterase [Megasphaera hominis]MBC3537695.1 phosphodiesterase [Megasphaera hominis]